MNGLNIDFPLDEFNELIFQMGWETFDEWFKFWNKQSEQKR